MSHDCHFTYMDQHEERRLQCVIDTLNLPEIMHPCGECFCCRQHMLMARNLLTQHGILTREVDCDDPGCEGLFSIEVHASDEKTCGIMNQVFETWFAGPVVVDPEQSRN